MDSEHTAGNSLGSHQWSTAIKDFFARKYASTRQAATRHLLYEEVLGSSATYQHQHSHWWQQQQQHPSLQRAWTRLRSLLQGPGPLIGIDGAPSKYLELIFPGNNNPNPDLPFGSGQKGAMMNAAIGRMANSQGKHTEGRCLG
jgi:hypothetical protein